MGGLIALLLLMLIAAIVALAAWLRHESIDEQKRREIARVRSRYAASRTDLSRASVAFNRELSDVLRRAQRGDLR